MCECPVEEEAGAHGLVASWWMLCEKPLCTMVTSRVEGKELYLTKDGNMCKKAAEACDFFVLHTVSRQLNTWSVGC